MTNRQAALIAAATFASKDDLALPGDITRLAEMLLPWLDAGDREKPDKCLFSAMVNIDGRYVCAFPRCFCDRAPSVDAMRIRSEDET